MKEIQKEKENKCCEECICRYEGNNYECHDKTCLCHTPLESTEACNYLKVDNTNCALCGMKEMHNRDHVCIKKENDWDKEDTDIRIHMQYSLMGNYTHDEWRVIIKNIKVLLLQNSQDTTENIIEKIKEFRHEFRNCYISNDFDIAFDDFINSLTK